MNEFIRNGVRTQRGVNDQYSEELLGKAGSESNLRGGGTQTAAKVEMLTDCHLVPQSVYTKSIHHVFCTMKPMKEFIEGRGYQLEKLRDETLHKYKVEELLDDDVIKLINEVYSEDFDLCDDFTMIPR